MIKQIARGIQVGYCVETCHPQGVYGGRAISQNFQLSRIFSHHGIVDHTILQDKKPKIGLACRQCTRSLTRCLENPNLCLEILSSTSVQED